MKELIDAARIGDIITLANSLHEGADVNFRTEQGFTLLIIASYNDQLEAAEILLKAGADVNGRDNGGNTALMGVCFKGYADIASLLLN